MKKHPKAYVKMATLITWTMLCYPFAFVSWKMGNLQRRDHVMFVYCRGLLRIMGVGLKVSGTLAEARPLLLVANHISYLDIPILSSHFPVRFTPKSEIATWPVVGQISRMYEAIFVDRDSKKITEEKNKILSSLMRGELVCIFPESTTGNGLHLQNFKSGFFSLAEEPVNGQALTIQPIAITYTHIRGLPIDITQWPSIAWYGDMELLPHAMHLFKIAPLQAEIILLPPVTLQDFANRKELAAHCQKAIAGAIGEVRNRPHHSKNKRLAFQPRFLRVKG